MNILRLSWSNYQTDESLENEARTLRSLGHQYLRPRESGPRPGKLTTYDVILVNSQFNVDESFLEQWDRDGLVLTASSGYDHIDLDACELQGVTVGRTPVSRAGYVCDYVRSSLHLLKRDFHRTGHPDRSTFWDRPGAFENIRSFDDIALGVLGFGVIGQQLMDYLDDFQFDSILVCDPLQEETIQSRDGVEPVPKSKLLEKSDVLTIHADLNPTTRNLFDEAALERMSDHAVLINAARGDMVDLSDLLDAVESNALGGAILDVLPEEPPESSRDLQQSGLYVTPHSAGFGPDLLEKLTEEIVESVRCYEQTETPVDPVKSRSDREYDRLKTRRDDEL